MTSTKEGGRGLGLSTVKDLIRANNGKLQLFSNDGCVVVDKNGEKYSNTGTNFEGTLLNIDLRYDSRCLYSYAVPRRQRKP